MRKTLEGKALEFGIKLTADPEGEMFPTTPDWNFVATIPEFVELSKKDTTSRWHQEKNMLTHTKMVCSEMQRLIQESNKYAYTRFSPDEMYILMFAALFHDLGKCRCQNSEDGRLLSNGHPEISERLCRKILWNMDISCRERICEIVRWHDLYCSSDISDGKLARKISSLSQWLFVHIDMLYAMFRADDLGSMKPEELSGSSDLMVGKIENILKTTWFHAMTGTKNFRKFTVYIMCGLPGSGKSTWAEKNLQNLPVVSRDLIREELGMTEKGVKFMGTPEQEDLVSKISAERVEELCRSGKSFVYDNMNSRERYRKTFLESIRKYNPVVRVVYLEVDDLTVLEKRRPEIADKGDCVFEKMVEKMEFPRPNEYDTIEILQDLSTGSDVVRKEIGNLHLSGTTPKDGSSSYRLS